MSYVSPKLDAVILFLPFVIISCLLKQPALYWIQDCTMPVINESNNRTSTVPAVAGARSRGLPFNNKQKIL